MILSARAVYLCIVYLCNISFYSDEDGWEFEDRQKIPKYSYKSVLYMLRNNYKGYKQMGYIVYNGDEIWEIFFLADPFLQDRIKRRKITSIDQLIHYAREATDRR